MKTAVVLFTAFAYASAYFIKLECPAGTETGNPFDCPNPSVCDDRACSDSQRICCAVTEPGQCGYQCVRGVYLGCFETFWRCYGTAPSQKPVLPLRRDGPFLYIDNQDAVVKTPGLATRIEYYAERTGVEIEFFMLEYVDTQFRYRKTSYSTTHTATNVGVQSVIINWRITRGNLRFAFRTSQSGVFPIPYANNKQDSPDGYHSFILPNSNDIDLNVPTDQQQSPSGVNVRFMARICINETSQQVPDSNCPYNPETTATTTTTTSTTPTVSSTTASTTPELTTGNNNNCITTKVPRKVGCIGQGAPQNPGNQEQRLTFGQTSYSMIDFTGSGELRDGYIHSVEYRVIRLLDAGEELWFRVWEAVSVGSTNFRLVHSVQIVPTEINERVILGNLELLVRDGMRLGFSFYSLNVEAPVPIRYTVTNEVDENGQDKGIPYTAAECADTAGCAQGVAVNDQRMFTSRSQLAQKQFRIRACMLVYETGTTCFSSTTPSASPPPQQCKSIFVDRAIGCIGQGAPQNPGTETQTLATGQNSYSMIDLTGSGELRDGVITSLEYRVIRLLEAGEQLWFRVWGPLTVGGADFELIFSVPLFPTEINVKILLGSLDLTVQDKMRLGFSFYSPNANAEVPIRYSVVNEVDENGADKGVPYTAAECNDAASCGLGVNVGDQRTFMDRNNLVQKQFRIRPCMIVKVPATTCVTGSVTSPMTTTTTTMSSTTTASSTTRTTFTTVPSTTGPCVQCPAGPPGPPGPPGPSGTAGRRRRDLHHSPEADSAQRLETEDSASPLFSLQSTQLVLLVWNSVLTLLIATIPVYIYRRRQHTTQC